jgi:CDP-glucose 4,6-dehydratase
MNYFGGVYGNSRVMITGHTGFKGSWLSLWLHELGAKVSGFSLDPETSPNHWDLLRLPTSDFRGDVRDIDSVREAFDEARPEIVFHLAAQPLVRRSFRDPLNTWSTNVMGTANVLEACRTQESVRAIVVVTTDKCYENREWPWGYREIDRLGGSDPYSASKASSELLASSYRAAFFSSGRKVLLATARAGNVIGGGDWSQDRLIPDLARAQAEQRPMEVRSPESSRPWQHVLDSLSGYLLLGQRLLSGQAGFDEAWNFGPQSEGDLSVANVLEKISQVWAGVSWNVSDEPNIHETRLLRLDSSKARSRLMWRSVWDFATSLEQTALWYHEWMDSGRVMSKIQLLDYLESATDHGHEWAQRGDP